jgi:hypothetical protein
VDGTPFALSDDDRMTSLTFMLLVSRRWWATRHHGSVASTRQYLISAAISGWRPPRFPAIVALMKNAATRKAEEDADGAGWSHSTVEARLKPPQGDNSLS